MLGESGLRSRVRCPIMERGLSGSQWLASKVFLFCLKPTTASATLDLEVSVMEWHLHRFIEMMSILFQYVQSKFQRNLLHAPMTQRGAWNAHSFPTIGLEQSETNAAAGSSLTIPINHIDQWSYVTLEAERFKSHLGPNVALHRAVHKLTQLKEIVSRRIEELQHHRKMGTIEVSWLTSRILTQSHTDTLSDMKMTPINKERTHKVFRFY